MDRLSPRTKCSRCRLDADDPAEVALAERLVAAGVDRVTTNDAPKLALALGQPAVF